MDKIQAFKDINETQDYYIDKLVERINDLDYTMMKMLNFTSPTGTGKTNMMAKLINKFPNYFFIITTLSKGQLHHQIRANLKKYCNQNNYVVFGNADYKKNSRIRAEDILAIIPENTKTLWLRDEAHIRTNKFDELLLDYQDVVGKCYAVINFSATNSDGAGIECNFDNTMMLRTVNQKIVGREKGPVEAINKLLEIKEQHKNVPNYNPCAIFRLVSKNDEWYDKIIDECNKHNLKVIDITDEEYRMDEICADDNEYDVIINKFKIVEGVDLRRAHVLYMDNQPGNIATIIQCVGRCRRNALLYRNDIDIFAPENKQLLKDTRECYVFYNTFDLKTQHEDEEIAEELQMAFCPYISCQRIKPNTMIHVENGQMTNGLYIMELCSQYKSKYGPVVGETGDFLIKLDEETGFNIVEPLSLVYDTEIATSHKYVYFTVNNTFKKCLTKDLVNFHINDYKVDFNYATGKKEFSKCNPYYRMDGHVSKVENVQIDDSVIQYFLDQMPNINKTYIKNLIKVGKKEKVAYKPIDVIIYREFDNLSKLIKATNISMTNDDIDFLYMLLKRSIQNISIKDKTLSDEYSDKLCVQIKSNLDVIKKTIKSHKVIVQRYISEDELNKYIKDVSDDERILCYNGCKVPVYENQFVDYEIQRNDKESAIIGIESMHMLSENVFNTKDIIWVENRSVSSKIGIYSKFNTFISDRYQVEIEKAKPQIFKGSNNFDFDEKCNSMIGYLVEYYSKYLVYGESYLGNFIQYALDEAGVKKVNNSLIIRACMLKYKANMMSCFGQGVGKVIRNISAEELIQDNYQEFIKTITNLGKQTANFVKKELYSTTEPLNKYDPNLSVRHITGLADYITEDTILDIKVRNNIDLGCIRQVLAYHYLSTKRSDLHIKRVIVYDATSDRHVSIDISPENWKENQPYGYKET